jgi:hypothetical protein
VTKKIDTRERMAFPKEAARPPEITQRGATPEKRKKAVRNWESHHKVSQPVEVGIIRNPAAPAT